MTENRTGVAGVCLRALAILWPLDVAAAVYPLPITLTAVVAALLVALTLLDIPRAGKLHVPFEYLVPVGLMAAVAVAYWLTQRGDPTALVEALGALALFICVAHWARDEAIQKECVLLSLNSGGVAVFASLVVLLMGHMPAAYASPWGVQLPFAFDVTSGVHIALLVGGLAVFVSGCKLYSSPQRTLSSLAVTFAVCFVLAKTAQGLRGPHGDWAGLTSAWVPLQYAGFGLALWLWARVAAKANVRAREESLPFSRLVLWLSLPTLLIIAIHPMPPRLFHGFVLGLVAATSLPLRPRETAAEWKPWAYGAAVLASVLLLAIPIVLGATAHSADERNYDRFALSEFASGNIDALNRRLDTITRFYPDEPGVFYWRARVALDNDNLEKAAVAYCQATRTPDGRILDAVMSNDRTEAFLSDMRDRIAYESHPEESPAYSRILAAHGEPAAALAYLDAQANNGLYLEWTGPRAPFAGAVANLIEPDFDVARLAHLEVGQLRFTLANWGAKEVTRPARSGEQEEFHVVTVQRWGSAAQISVFGGEAENPMAVDAAPVVWGSGIEPAKVSWNVTLGDDDMLWRAELHVAGEPEEILATIQAHVGGHAFVRWEEGGPDALPYTPAVLVIAPEAG